MDRAAASSTDLKNLHVVGVPLLAIVLVLASLVTVGAASAMAPDSGTIDFEFEKYAVDEGGSVDIHVLRTGGSEGEISASFIGVSGDAVPNGVDFNTSPNSFTFADGETKKTVTLTGITDTLNEGDETYVFRVLGTNKSGDEVGGGDTTFTVVDAGFSPGTIDFEFDGYSVDEGGSVNIRVLRTGGSEGEISASFIGVSGDAVPNGIDFNTSPNSFTFADGETMKTAVLTGVTDALNEGLETYVFRVLGTDVNGDPVGGGNTTFNILDDGFAPGAVGFSSATYTVTEGDTATLTLVRTGGADGPLTIRLSSGGGSATPRDDFVIPGQDYTMADGETSIDIEVVTLSDALNEGAENFLFTIAATDLNDDTVTGAPKTTTLTIDDVFEPGFVAVTPVRIVDSRPAFQVGPFGSPWGAGQTRTVDATTVLSGIPDSATAIAAHVTTVGGDPAFSWLTVYPSDALDPPLDTASVTYGTADVSTVITNDLIITKIDGDGNFSIYNETGSTDLVIDIVGYYTDDGGAGGSGYVAVTPERIIDSRPDGALNTGPFATKWGPLQSRVIDASAATGVPTGITAVAVNVSTVNGTAAGSWLTVHPTGTARPGTASINFGTDSAYKPITNDLVITGVNANGEFTVYNQAGDVDVVIDIVGYFTTDPAAGDYVSISPQRIVDSRPAQLNIGPFDTPWDIGTERDITVTVADEVPSGVSAVAVQVTTIGATAPISWLTTYPADDRRPEAASILYGTNPLTAAITNDLVITGVDSRGNFTVYNETGKTDVIIDIVGYIE